MWSVAAHHGVSLASSVSSVRLAHIPLLVVSGSTGLIGTCYVLAATAGHARVLLPMISDCFRRAPESYLAGWGMAGFACVGLLLSVLAMGGYLQRFQAVSAAEVRLRVCSAWLGLLACAGFGEASLVTERDDNFMHCAGALVGFFAYYLYAIVLTAALYRCREAGAASRTSLGCKAACISLGMLAVLAFCCLVANGALDRKVGGEDGDRAVAFCEWVSVLSMALFNLTFRLEFGNDLRLSDVWPATAKNIWAWSAKDACAEPLLAAEPAQA